MWFKGKQKIEGNVSGGKLIGVRNECSLTGKKSTGSKPKDADEECEERPMEDVAAVEV